MTCPGMSRFVTWYRDTETPCYVVARSRSRYGADKSQQAPKGAPPTMTTPTLRQRAEQLIKDEMSKRLTITQTLSREAYCPQCDTPRDWFRTTIGFAICTYCGTRMLEGAAAEQKRNARLQDFSELRSHDKPPFATDDQRRPKTIRAVLEAIRDTAKNDDPTPLVEIGLSILNKSEMLETWGSHRQIMRAIVEPDE